MREHRLCRLYELVRGKAKITEATSDAGGTMNTAERDLITLEGREKIGDVGSDNKSERNKHKSFFNEGNNGRQPPTSV